MYLWLIISSFCLVKFYGLYYILKCFYGTKLQNYRPSKMDKMPREDITELLKSCTIGLIDAYKNLH